MLGAVVATAVAFTGTGRYSLDHAFGRCRETVGVRGRPS